MLLLEFLDFHVWTEVPCIPCTLRPFTHLPPFIYLLCAHPSGADIVNLMPAHAVTFLIVGLAILVGLWIFSKILKLVLLAIFVVVLIVAFSIYNHPKSPATTTSTGVSTSTSPSAIDPHTTAASRDLTQRIGDEALHAASSLSSHDLVVAVDTLVHAYNIIHPSIHLTATQHGADRLNITSSVGSACLTFSGHQVVTSPAPCRVS